MNTLQGPGNPAEKEAAAARANFPIPPACGIYYYEVQILDKGARGYEAPGPNQCSASLLRLIVGILALGK